MEPKYQKSNYRLIDSRRDTVNRIKLALQEHELFKYEMIDDEIMLTREGR